MGSNPFNTYDYFRLIVGFVVTCAVFGLVAPTLVSAGDDLSAAAGAVLVFFYPVFIYRLLRPLVAKLTTENDK